MLPFSVRSRSGGHPRGGPRCLSALTPAPGTAGRARIVLPLAAALLAACGGQSGPERPRPTRAEPFSRPLEIYRDLGFMTGSGQFPAVASFATIAGPADSSYVLLGLSIPNSALRFQREGTGFFAEYNVQVAFLDHDSVTVKRFDARETVRIASFAETGRTDESIVHQQAFAMPPGRYILRLQAADANSSRGFRMTDTLTVPAYGTGVARLASPVLVYRAHGRTSRDSLPALIFNPRHTVPYGGEAPLLYLESYDTDAPLDVQVVNDAGVALWSTRTRPSQGGQELRYAVVEIPSETLPLGRFWLNVAPGGAAPARTPLVLTISDQWMVANFDEVLRFLRYIAHSDELDSLRVGSPAEQRAAWDRFWARRDPLPITDINEFRDQFFQRVRYATEAFRESGGRAGWQTDRGEVFIVLGAPDHVIERFVGRPELTGQPNAEEWTYDATPGGRLNLLFHDRSGFGRFELVPASSSAFRAAAERLKPRPERAER
jgi:GWxTD domain-containing protein